jgi:general secretion pathway protein K
MSAPSPARARRRARPGRRSERGAALLVAITAVAILTALTVDLAYNTRVSLQAAANARDELRATGQARSGVALSRLVLHLQGQLDALTSGAQSAIPLGGAVPQLSIRLWDFVPLDSSATQLFPGTGDGGRRSLFETAALRDGDAAGAARGRPGDPAGSFQAEVQDEEAKINLLQFDGTSGRAFSQALRLAQLVAEPRWDFLFDEDDANGLRVSRPELFAAILDWQDQNETSAAFTGDPAKPFENGFGDENPLYDRLPDRYKAKNARFDSLDELYMVAGVSDAFMAAFGDKLTVYPGIDTCINVNTTDPRQLLVNALLMSDPPGVPQPALADPAFLTNLQTALTLMRPFPFIALSPQQFAAALQSLGVRLQSIFTQQSAADPGRNPFCDKSATFRIRSVGTAGEVHKTIEAVVTFDRRAEGLARDAGRLLHWHEE